MRTKFYSYSVKKICALGLNRILAIICTLLAAEVFSRQKVVAILKEG